MADIMFVVPMTQLSMRQEINGTMLLATKLLDAGFDTQILRFCQIDSYGKDYTAFIRDITDRIIQSDAKCVSFYTLWPDYHVALRIACEIKKRHSDIITILGGPQASATAKETMDSMDHIDYICTGEGENTIVPFFQAILKGDQALSSIPGLYYRQDGSVMSNDINTPLCDLDTLPHWDDRLYLDLYKTPEPGITSDGYFMPIDAGRGCPYSCTFCCTSYFWRRTYRLKSPERIVDDILFYNRKFGIRSFWFSHDAFTTNRQLVEQVCDHIIEKGLDIKWRCSTRLDCISEELILKMKQAGLVHISLGVETGSKRMQKLINKNLDLERVQKMIALLLNNKLGVELFFMYGFPDETEEDLAQTLALLFSMLDMGVQQVTMAMCKFNPSTAITEKCFDQLEFDPSIKILSRGIFGHDEEIEMILQNKALFPFYYHLNTPVRNEYQYLYFLVLLYQQFPNSIKYLRKLYDGDDLRFYRDFYHNNLPCFEKDPMHMTRCIFERSIEMLDNTMKGFDLPCIPQLKGLLRYVHDAQKVAHAREDTTLRQTYDFNIIDFQLKRPIEQYSVGQTEILLQKVDGKMEMKVLRIS